MFNIYIKKQNNPYSTNMSTYSSNITLNQILMSNYNINDFLKNSSSGNHYNSCFYESSGYSYKPSGNHYFHGGGGAIGCVGSASDNLSILPTISAPK